MHGRPEYKTRCTICQPRWERAHRKANRTRYAANAKRRKLKMKLRCIALLGGACTRCGYDKSTRALTFHHRERHTKEHSISQIKDRSWKLIEKELKKCVLICFNCHMELEEEHDRNRE